MSKIRKMKIENGKEKIGPRNGFFFSIMPAGV
jgi:hypothetical protein